MYIIKDEIGKKKGINTKQIFTILRNEITFMNKNCNINKSNLT